MDLGWGEFQPLLYGQLVTEGIPLKNGTGTVPRGSLWYSMCLWCWIFVHEGIRGNICLLKNMYIYIYICMIFPCWFSVNLSLLGTCCCFSQRKLS